MPGQDVLVGVDRERGSGVAEAFADDFDRDARLVEAVDDRRGRFLRTVSPLITGSPDRDSRNADTMETTLEAIKAAAETPDR
jgi:hypothetical protein